MISTLCAYPVSMEADSILIVDPDAVMPLPIAAEPLKAVSGRNRKLANIANAVNLRELPPRHGPPLGWAGGSSGSRRGAIEDVFRATIREGSYHSSYYNVERIRTREGPCGPPNLRMASRSFSLSSDPHRMASTRT